MVRNKRFGLLVLFILIATMIFTGCTALEDVNKDIGKIVETLDHIEAEINKEIEDLNKEKDEDIPKEKNEKSTDNEKDNNQDFLGEGELKLHFIDIGQGNATFIEGSSGETILYDAGGDGDVGRIVVDYIKNLGYDKIDNIVLTHPHADHINGVVTILEEIEVKAIYHPKVVHTTKTFERLVEAVQNAGLKFKTAKAGVKIPFGEVEALMVAPLSDEYSNLNDYSATIKLTLGKHSVLLTGDVEKLSEQEMINSEYDLDVDILLIPHHGSNSSSTQGFLDKTTPSFGVISSAKDNTYGHPHKEVVERLKENNIGYYNTADYGNIVAIIDNEDIRFILGEIK